MVDDDKPDDKPEGVIMGDIEALRRLLDPDVDIDKELADQPRLRELVKILRGESQ